MKLTVEYVKSPSWGLSIWKEFVSKGFYMPKGGFLFELGVMTVGRLGYVQETWAYLTHHGVHDDELIRLLAWSAELGLDINMSK